MRRCKECKGKGGFDLINGKDVPSVAWCLDSSHGRVCPECNGTGKPSAEEDAPGNWGSGSMKPSAEKEHCTEDPLECPAVKRFADAEKGERCPECNGVGRIEHKHSPNPDLIGMVMLPCPKCHGTAKPSASRIGEVATADDNHTKRIRND